MTEWKDFILAHLDKKTNKFQQLIDHLSQTAVTALESLSPAVQFDVLSQHELKTIVKTIGKFHDLGKFTDFFQSYIKYGRNVGDLKNHAHISALVLYRYLQMFIPLECNADHQEVLRYLIYLTVRLHHDHLRTDGLFPQSKILHMTGILKQQAAQLLKKADQIAPFYGIDQSGLVQILDVVSTFQNKTLTLMNQKLLSRRKHERWYFILLYLFSLLIDSDKLDSAGLGRKSLVDLTPDLISAYLKKKHETDHRGGSQTGVIDSREKARRSILAVVESLTEEQLENCRLFTLTAPTGIGKTLSSLQAALVLRRRLKSLMGRHPRIITAIPFINILQGTEIDYKGALGEDLHLIVHHQNADLFSQKTIEDVPLDKKLLEVESWEGDIILTTFVQLFQSLITGNNRLLKKLNKLAGSIVILDEIQSIPEEYMPLIGACLIKLGEYYGTRFILMTATQPRIIELGIRLLKQSKSDLPKDHFMQTIELLPDNKEYFQTLRRTKIIPVLDREMNIQEFVDFFLKTWDRRSSVIVVNTIKQSLDLYNKLLNIGIDDTEIRYLSTNLMPKHRKTVIQEVKEMLNDGRRVILVSTQTIEAGVDLDFDVGYRALAPLESIVQTAGRVNRQGKKLDEEGRPVVCPVYVVNLGGSHHYVYDLQHLERTRHFLSMYSGKEIEEREYQSLIETYYAELFKHPLADSSRVIWEKGIMALRFEEIEKFQLIKDIGEVCDVFVEWDDEATRLADCYSELKATKDRYDLEMLKSVFPESEINAFDPVLNFHQRKALLKVVMNKMGNYMIQIRFNRIRKNRPFSFQDRNGVEAPFLWIPKEDLGYFYSQNTGYLDESGEAYLI